MGADPYTIKPARDADLRGSAPPATTDRSERRWGRLADFWQTWFVDHGMLRAVYRNRHRVAPGVYRSNHPLPFHIAQEARAGTRTVICFRKERGVMGPFRLSSRACERFGIDHLEVPLNSRAAPRREQIHALKAAFETARYPLLMHCKSGADRAGLGGALYLLLQLDRPVEEAMAQLNWRYGHVRQARTGVLDFFLQRYAEHHRLHGTLFLRWLDEVYDPDELQSSFRARLWAERLDRWLLRRE